MHRKSVIIGTYGPDDDRKGIGSSAYVGDYSNNLLMVPPAVFDGRYLFRLASRVFDREERCTLVRFWTKAFLGFHEEDQVSGSSYPIKREILSPYWSPADGNISFHLRWIEGNPRPSVRQPNAPGISTDLYGTAPARLANASGPLSA